jgi:hypothetical protein
MALQGINMPLMPLGMEALQAATFAGLGLGLEQLQDFFPGPAFLAWGRMGNIQVRRATACWCLSALAAACWWDLVCYNLDWGL